MTITLWFVNVVTTDGYTNLHFFKTEKDADKMGRDYPGAVEKNVGCFIVEIDSNGEISNKTTEPYWYEEGMTESYNELY